jgi:hypothetical protein
MTPSFALGIPHTPWVPERVETLARLHTQLGLDTPDAPHPAVFRLFADKEPNWSWAERLWNWALGVDATHLLQLQDDVIVGAEFWPQLTAMVHAVPDQIIGLESVLDIGAPWYTTGDGLIGVGYVVPLPVLAHFLTWRRTQLRPGAVQALNEDQLMGIYAFATGQRIFHPRPTIIDHDAEIASTYGNDRHSHRRPARSTVRGDAPPASWQPPEFIPHRAKFYGATPSICRRWVRGYSFERYRKDLSL